MEEMQHCKKHNGIGNDYFAYADSTYYVFIAIDVIAIALNGYDIYGYVKSSRRKQKNKTSSLEKLLCFLAFVEMLLGLYWVSNVSFFSTGKIIEENCGLCRTLGLIGLFLYTLDWLLMTSTIFQLRKIITNPVNGVLNADAKIKSYLLYDLIIALVSTFVGWLFNLEGISPMNSCFLQTSNITEGKHRNEIVFWVILSIPLLSIIFGLYHIIRILNSKATRNDNEMLNLFHKYRVYIWSYCICSCLLVSIYIIDRLSSPQETIFFQWYIYFCLIIICSNSIVCFCIRIIRKNLKKDRLKIPRPGMKLRDYVYNSHQAPLIEGNEFDWLEKKVISNFMRDVFVSVSYCLTKNVENNREKIIDSTIDKDKCLETKFYTITTNSIENDKLVKDTIGRDEVIKDAEYLKIKVVEYAPKIFSLLRKYDNINEMDMIYSLLPGRNKIGISKSEGRSGNFFINTDDKHYIIKTINYEDVELIRGLLLEQMTKHFKYNPSSLIGRIYGLFKLILPNGEEVIMLLMQNVFGIFDEDNILCKFDLKGSKLNRYENVDKNPLENMVMKDENFSEIEHSLLLNQEWREALFNNATRDAKMLNSLKIMDYSLLVVKLSFNKDEITALFGSQHKSNTEKDYIALLANDDGSNEQESQTKSENTAYDNNNIRFKLSQVTALKKYMFPSLKYDIVYIAAIIDFFQLYNMRKNLETKFKLIHAVKEDISSIPPNEYMERFIKNLMKITDVESLLKNNTDGDSSINSSNNKSI